MNINKFININDWMHSRPYKVAAAYDRFYLEIWRRLFGLLQEAGAEVTDAAIELDEQDYKDLAFVLTGYFEDRVNGIGFWDVVLKMHHELYGKRIPFYTKEELALQKDEEIHPADVHYLIFSWYLLLFTDEEERSITPFRQPLLTALTEAACHYFDSIDEVETSDFFTAYLLPDADYISFKGKLHWFVFNSYLFRMDFKQQRDRQMAKLQQQDTNMELLMPAFYELEDGLLFEYPAATLSALFPLDVLAGALHCDEDKKEEIKNLKFRAYGIFEVQKKGTDLYAFTHTGTGEHFDVLKSSFNQSMLKEELSGYFLTHVVQWNSTYSISGMCLSVNDTPDGIAERNLRRQHAFQKHFLPYRKQVNKIAKAYSDVAFRFFGSRLVQCANGKELQKKWDEFQNYYVSSIAAENNKPVDEAPRWPLDRDLVNEPGEITIFVKDGDNFSFVYYPRELMAFLQDTDPASVSEYDLLDKQESFTEKNIEVDYWRYLRQQYTLPNLSFLLGCPVTEDADFEAALRIYKPNHFSPLTLPSFSIVDIKDENDHL